MYFTVVYSVYLTGMGLWMGLTYMTACYYSPMSEERTHVKSDIIALQSGVAHSVIIKMRT